MKRNVTILEQTQVYIFKVFFNHGEYMWFKFTKRKDLEQSLRWIYKTAKYNYFRIILRFNISTTDIC